MESSDIYNLGYRTKDVNESIYWLNLAAEKGHIGAQKKLAEIYEDGQKVTQNYDEAIKWYSMAAYLGDTQAQRKLGICYIKNNKDYIKAYAWLTIATEQGSNMSRKKRDEITDLMSFRQINEANKLIKEIRAYQHQD